MNPTRPAGGEHVRVLAVLPAVTAPTADPPLAADAAPSAAVLRAAASGSLAPRAQRAAPALIEVVTPTAAHPAIDPLVAAPPVAAHPAAHSAAHRAVPAAPAPRTALVPTQAAVLARAMQ